MITIDTATLLVLLLAAGVAGALAVVLPPWRGLADRGADLPVWHFLTRRKAVVGGYAALQAELRCDLCAGQERCAKLLAAGAHNPAPGCPNLELFQER